MRIVITIFLTVFMMFNTVSVWADVFTGTGSAMVINNDKAQAKSIAGQSALRKALSLAMESLIPAQSPDRLKLNAKKGEMLRQQHTFIKGQKVTDESMKGKLLTLKMDVDIDMNELKRFLGAQGVLAAQASRMKKQEFPSVSVIMAEEISGQVNTDPFSERIVRQAFLDALYEVVDDKLAAKSINHDKAVQALLNNDVKAARAVALQYDAGVVISGKALVQASGVQSGGMNVHGANVTLEAIETSTGKILATASAEGHYPHINAMTASRKAIEDASVKAAKQLLKEITAAMEISTQTVVVTISGINFKQLAIIKKILKRDFSQIVDIKQKAFNGTVAKLDIGIDGSVSGWIDALALKDFGTFRLEVMNFTSGKVDLKIKLNSN